MKPSGPEPPRIAPLVFALVTLSSMVASKASGGDFDGGSSRFPGSVPGVATSTWNGIPGNQQADGAKGLDAFQAMLWKYTARCALPEGQQLQAPAATDGKRLKFPGFFGIAPEWRNGACDRACQEKVSSCLIALTNRTGKHVLVSILSADPSMNKKFLPGDNELGFPHQEGAFFGNVFSNTSFACQGRDVRKAPQVKRFCASEPETCSGVTQFVDVGSCEDACEMACSKLSDGTERCAALSCRDPGGTRWDHPVTTYLRNRIEAVNTDEAAGVRIKGERLESLDDGDSVTFNLVDFGDGHQHVDSFATDLVTPRAQGQIDIWLDGTLRIGVLKVLANGDPHKDQTTAIQGEAVTGPHAVTLKIVGGKNIGRLSTFEFRRGR